MDTRIILARASRVLAGAAVAGALALPLPALAQYAIGDAQLSAAVETALTKNSQVGSLGIGATTSNGVVTLTGTVPNEADRTQAEQIAGNVDGVRSLQDNITVDASAAGAAATPAAPPAATAESQMPPPPPDTGATAAPEAAAAPSPSTAVQQPPAQAGTMPPPPPVDAQASSPGYAQGPSGPGQYGPGPGQYSPGYAQGQGQYSQGGQDNNGWGQRGSAHVPGGYSALGVSPQQQNASGPVTIPAASLLSVRTEQPLSTEGLKAGDVFQVTEAADVYENGVVAIPRGAVFTGQVVESKNAGAFGGRPKLDLRLTSIQLGATTYPLASQVWSSEGPNKAGYTAANTAGGAIFGALIGAVAGGGVGAGIGALAGGAGGAAVSGATRGPHINLPPETLLEFHLAQPLTVQPVQFTEAERLANSVPNQPRLMRRPAYYAPYPPRVYAPYYGAPYPY